MNSPLFWLFVFLAILPTLIGMTVLLHKYLKLPVEQSRKFIHVAGGLVCLLFPSFFTSHWWVLVLTLASFLTLFITYKRKMLPAIHQTKRYSLGSVLFPLPVYGCFLMAEINKDVLFFYLPVSLLAISDTAAEIGGTRWGAMSKQFFNSQKTLTGSVCFFITAAIVSFGWLHFGLHLPVADVLGIGLAVTLFATIAELITLHGWDNITVPAITILVLQLLR
jgi:phytol kinase